MSTSMEPLASTIDALRGEQKSLAEISAACCSASGLTSLVRNESRIQYALLDEWSAMIMKLRDIALRPQKFYQDGMPD